MAALPPPYRARGSLQSMVDSGLSLTLSSSFFFSCCGAHRYLHSFPTRRSSDLAWLPAVVAGDTGVLMGQRLQSALTDPNRSEEHTSELQSPVHLVCSLLHEKKTKVKIHP